MWSAVCACSESRDRILKFGRGHFRCDVISGSIGCLATRPRYSCPAARICILDHVTNATKVGVVAQNRPPFVSGVIFAAVLTLETEASRFLGNYQSHTNETAIYVVSGVCLFRIT